MWETGHRCMLSPWHAKCSCRRFQTSQVGRENRGTATLAATRVTGTWCYSNWTTWVAATGPAVFECVTTWQIQLNDQTISSQKYDVNTKFHGVLTCPYDVMVSAVLQDYQKVTTHRVYGADVLCYSTHLTKFGRHIESRSAINAVAFRFFLFSFLLQNV